MTPTLYDADRCPYCARVRIVLAEKGIPYDTISIDLGDRPAWLYEKNPVGKVPVLEEGAFCLPESVVIMEYLEERYPEPALLPPDPGERALVRLAVERFDTNLGDAYYAFRRGEQGSQERLARCLSALERGGGLWPDCYTLAEIAYAPWLIRLRDQLGLDLSSFPSLLERLDRLAERPAVAAELEVVAALAS